MEEPGILQNHGEGAPQRRPCQRPDILSVHINGAAVHIIKPHQQVDNGGFSGPGRSDDGRHTSWLGMEVQIPDNRLTFHIGKVHMLHTNIAFHIGQFLSIRCIGPFRLCINQREYTLSGCQCTLQLGDDIGRFVDWSGKFPGILHEAAQISQTDFPPQKQKGSEHTDQCQRHIVDEVDRWTGDSAIGFCDGICLHRLRILPVKILQHHVFPPIGTDGFLARQHFFHKPIQGTQTGTAPLKERAYAP